MTLLNSGYTIFLSHVYSVFDISFVLFGFHIIQFFMFSPFSVHFSNNLGLIQEQKSTLLEVLFFPCVSLSGEAAKKTKQWLAMERKVRAF